MPIADKILPIASVDAWVSAERGAGRRIGFTCGAFDLMHAGHAHYLEAARALCDRLLVAVNSDASIQRYKNPLRPINPWPERAYTVAALASTDCVTELDEDRPLTLIQRWKPDLYIKGGDYAAQTLRSRSAVEEYGGKTVVIPPRFGSSTTAMLERIQAASILAQPMVPNASQTRGLVLLDLDGTLVRDACFDPSRMELLPGVVPALQHLSTAGFRLCILTNQQGIGVGYFGYRDFVDGCRKLLRELGAARIPIARIYFCPHSLGEPCDCRKPAPGMILRALREQNIAAEQCFVIGDSEMDMDAAQAAHCRGFYTGQAHPRFRSHSIEDAARLIAEESAGT